MSGVAYAKIDWMLGVQLSSFFLSLIGMEHAPKMQASPAQEFSFQIQNGGFQIDGLWKEEFPFLFLCGLEPEL